MHKGILLSDDSNAILYQPEKRLFYILAITAFLHVLILLTVNFQPLYMAFETFNNKSYRAVNLTLEKNTVAPEVAHYINLVDQRGALSQTEEDINKHTIFNSIKVHQNEVSLITSSENDVGWDSSLREQSLVEETWTPKTTRVATHQQAHAAYLYRWQQYIEAIGSELYPKEALQKNIIGQLTLRVVILEDGRTKEIEIYRTSGQPLLDEAAIDIVSQAQPFERVPKEMLADNGTIEIVRIWDFNGKLNAFSNDLQG